MLKNSEKYYLYRHIRLDTGNVFYIGIGTGRRAWKKENRNKHWHNIVNAAGYEVEILMGGLTRDIAIGKEKEFIALYGEMLCNMTGGGEGFFLGKHSSESRKKMSDAKRKLFENEEYKAKHISKLHKPGGWNKGMSLPIEQKKKMSEAAKVRAERKRTKGGQYA